MPFFFFGAFGAADDGRIDRVGDSESSSPDVSKLLMKYERGLKRPLVSYSPWTESMPFFDRSEENSWEMHEESSAGVRPECKRILDAVLGFP